MPQPSFSPPSRKRSASPPSPPVSGAKKDPSSGIFTADLPESHLDEPASEEDFSPSQADTPFPPDGSLSATEPFPDGLFRLPLPDWVFSKMAGMSDSALRSLLGLTRLSFRFDPAEATWVKPARSFTRKEIESETGLSSQGARNGLAELAEASLVSIDTSGRSYEYTLEISVPTARYTYVPTAFLEAASALSGTELRLVLTVLRATWGWTTSSNSSGSKSVEHRRWARLSLSKLARRTGRSETAIKDAATQLQGRYLERLRPTGGAYYYRFLPEAVRPDTNSIEESSGESASEKKSAGETSEPSGVRVKKKAEARIRLSLYGGIANDLAMGRQKSAPPYAYREFTLEKKAQQGAREQKSSSESATPKRSEDAVLGNPSSPPENKRRGSGRGKSRASSRRSSSRQRKSPRSNPESSNRAATDPSDIDLSRFAERLQELGEILISVGVRPRCVPGLLTRFSAGRIEANLQLYRRRAPAVEKPGAWLYAAITQGFALPSPKKTASEETSTEEAPSGRPSETNQGGGSSFLPEPGEKVSETLRRELIREGLAREEDFDKFSDYDDPDRKQHFFQLEKAESPTGR